MSVTCGPTCSVTDTSARISFRLSTSGTVKVRYSTSSDLSSPTTTAGVSVDSTTDFTGRVDVFVLLPNTTYYYTLVVDDVAVDSSNYPTLKTFPASGLPGVVKFVFGSCTMHHAGDDGIFAAVPADAAFLMHLGDLIYDDIYGSSSASVNGYRTNHRDAMSGDISFKSDGFAALRREKPIFTMWDDHDVVNDYSGGPFTARYAWARQAFLEYHGQSNPDGENPSHTGSFYYSFVVGDVGFFVLDLRSYRSPNTDLDDESKTVLGADQLDALKAWLLTNNDAYKIKVLCLSNPAHGYASNTAGDSWGGVDDSTQSPSSANGFRTERNALWEWIDANGISGVFAVSADQHWSGFFKTEWNSRPRYEFAASPYNQYNLTQVARAADSVNGPVFWKYQDGVAMGVVTIDTTVDPPTISTALYDDSGDLGAGYQKTLDLDDLDEALAGWVLMSGETAKTLTISSVDSGDIGRKFRCVATNAVGEATSNIAEIVLDDSDADALDYFSRAEGLGGSFDQSLISGTYTAEYVKDAITAFVAGCKTDSIWTKLTEVYLLGGVSYAGLMAKLKYDSVATLTNNNFVSGAYIAAGSNLGVIGDANTRTLSTGFDSLGSVDQSLSAYVTAAASLTNSQIYIGSYGTASAGHFLGQVNSGNQEAYQSSSNADATSYAGTTVARRNGFLTGSCRTTTDREMYRNGASTNQNTSSFAAPLGPHPLSIFGGYNYVALTHGLITNARISFAHIGTGLTSAEVLLLSNRVNTLMTALGGNVY